MEKILSVSIAAYNVESTLREAIEPFLKSEVLDFLDVMIIDDGAKDGTPAMARKYEEQYPDSIRFIHKENGGWGSTVNTGIAQARGKYFKQLDGDDYYEPGNLKKFIEILKDTEADMVISTYVTFDSETGAEISVENCNPGYETNQVLKLSDLSGFGPFMHSLCIRTDLLQKSDIKITEKCFYTDTEFVLKACNQAYTVMFLDFSVYYYRRASVGQSMSLSGFEKHYMEQYRVIEECLEYKAKYVTRPEIHSIFDQLLSGTCFWQYLVMLYISPTGQHKKDLMSYDRMLLTKAPDYYNKVHFKELDLLRKYKFFGYSILARMKKKRDNRFTEDGRLAN